MYIADLHIHSRYSRATSKECTPEYLDLWARKKGIHIVGTGDFTHPKWRKELKEKLMPAEDGLYVLKEEFRIHEDEGLDQMIPRFVVTGEISSIYKKMDRVRKVHSLILLPGLEEAEVISERLEEIGNIHSDGRPILGLPCHDLLEILLELCPEAVYVPAHIWTPHFSLFGAFSGFDTIEACFDDLTPYIHAVETGLSSDPPMNWRVPQLDNLQLISNSDAHSPAKLGREATLFDIPLSYDGLKQAIETGKGLYGTIEFFPEEGKYHMDGHRKCNLCLSPLETEQYHGICPVCGRKITIGVSHRIEQLAKRPEGYQKEDAKCFESLVPLPEIIGASFGYSSASVKVQREYSRMLAELGDEFSILRTIPIEDIRHTAGERLSEGIRRLREGKVERIPGFDGEYGTIRLFTAHELENAKGQMDFFSIIGAEQTQKKKEIKKPEIPCHEDGEEEQISKTVSLNPQQMQAVTSVSRRTAVIAGPGTGKTKTLVSHIVYLMENRKVKPSEITAVTFTNQAAREMRERIQKECSSGRKSKSLQIGTFHSVCFSFLKDRGVVFSLVDETEQTELAGEVIETYRLDVTTSEFLNRVSLWKSGALSAEGEKEQEACMCYDKKLKERNLFDFDDLLLETLHIVEKTTTKENWKRRFSYLLVDEFQDINPLQYRLMKAWNELGKELFVIGDPDQSIYGFRGADAGCFDRMQEEFKDLSVIRLTENYRSASHIVNAAIKMISANPGEERVLHANYPEAGTVRIVTAQSEMEEAIFIAKEINRLVGGVGMLEAHAVAEQTKGKKVRSFDEIAVLYRTHRQAELLEKCLKQEGIPYEVAGRESFLKEKTVQGSLRFFEYLENPEDVYAMEQTIKLLLGIQVQELSRSVVKELGDRFRLTYQKKKAQKFLQEWLEEMNLTENPAMEKLLKMSVFYKNMPEFMKDLRLGVESDLHRTGGKHYMAECVKLMTLHGAKGLEFPVTVIYGAEKGKIPLESDTYETDAEEERRLFYVGMTRAKEELILTASKEESEFLSDIPQELIEREKTGKKKESYHQMSLFE
nr:UvrD-helicase domain-containing protein [uncultured Sellimonas sp.]